MVEFGAWAGAACIDLGERTQVAASQPLNEPVVGGLPLGPELEAEGETAAP